MYDNDALTLTHEQVGSGTYTFLSGTNVKYIVGVAVQQSGVSSDTLVKCGSTTILRNYGKENNFQQMSYRCADVVTVDKTGNDSAFVTITYINRDIQTTVPISISASVSASINQDQIHMFYSFDILILLAVGVILGFLALR